uniref:HYR domain-containing protein n=1 Tax=Chromera velia CCMP2878 TaxID=1169474 RepID=A0A0G4GQ81_9ALVE|eukprot:Cvel_5025.t1-p1 / transcript=Cvel_5025.t1 / gene=Cvel_5025 / organism=Chromera_velia_CCMP2878 / gene_product=hypothetical protein / transcript_product=hypothetical protein / location=Cvel_scaffold228:74801-84348(-) / protein_length=1826 / sequence_SO=supercontig / SO=protein_coding / is_pseudo=false
MPVVYPAQALVFDNVDAPTNVDVRVYPPSGTGFEPGSHTVTVTATDTSGNAGVCTFVVVVVACPSGAFRDCADCPCICGAGYWQDLRGLETVERSASFPTVCRSCIQESSSESGSFHPSQCLCNAGHYFVPDTSKGSDQTDFFFWEAGRCMPCPENAVCDGGERGGGRLRRLEATASRTAGRVTLPPADPDSSYSSMLPLQRHSRPVPEEGHSLIEAFPLAVVLECPKDETCFSHETKGVYQDLDANGGFAQCAEGFRGVSGSLFNFLSLLAVLSEVELSNVKLPAWADLSTLVPVDMIPSVADLVRLECITEDTLQSLGIENPHLAFFASGFASLVLPLGSFVLLTLAAFALVFSMAVAGGEFRVRKRRRRSVGEEGWGTPGGGQERGDYSFPGSPPPVGLPVSPDPTRASAADSESSLLHDLAPWQRRMLHAQEVRRLDNVRVLLLFRYKLPTTDEEGRPRTDRTLSETVGKLTSMIFEDMVPVYIMVYFLTFEGILESLIELVSCQPLSDGLAPRLNSSPSVECTSELYRQWMPLAVTAIVVVGIVVPLFLAERVVAGLKKLTREGARTWRSQFRRRYGFLLQGYREGFLYWEIVIMLRKLAVQLAVAFYVGNNPDMRLIQVSMLSVFFILVQGRLKPFSMQEMNLLNHIELNALATFTLALALFQALYFSTMTENQALLFASALLAVLLCFLVRCCSLIAWGFFQDGVGMIESEALKIKEEGTGNDAGDKSSRNFVQTAILGIHSALQPLLRYADANGICPHVQLVGDSPESASSVGACTELFRATARGWLGLSEKSLPRSEVHPMLSSVLSVINRIHGHFRRIHSLDGISEREGGGGRGVKGLKKKKKQAEEEQNSLRSWPSSLPSNSPDSRPKRDKLKSALSVPRLPHFEEFCLRWALVLRRSLGSPEDPNSSFDEDLQRSADEAEDLDEIFYTTQKLLRPQQEHPFSPMGSPVLPGRRGGGEGPPKSLSADLQSPPMSTPDLRRGALEGVAGSVWVPVERDQLLFERADLDLVSSPSVSVSAVSPHHMIRSMKRSEKGKGKEESSSNRKKTAVRASDLLEVRQVHANPREASRSPEGAGTVETENLPVEAEVDELTPLSRRFSRLERGSLDEGSRKPNPISVHPATVTADSSSSFSFERPPPTGGRREGRGGICCCSCWRRSSSQADSSSRNFGSLSFRRLADPISQITGGSGGGGTKQRRDKKRKAKKEKDKGRDGEDLQSRILPVPPSPSLKNSGFTLSLPVLSAAGRHFFASDLAADLEQSDFLSVSDSPYLPPSASDSSSSLGVPLEVLVATLLHTLKLHDTTASWHYLAFLVARSSRERASLKLFREAKARNKNKTMDELQKVTIGDQGDKKFRDKMGPRMFFEHTAPAGSAGLRGLAGLEGKGGEGRAGGAARLSSSIRFNASAVSVQPMQPLSQEVNLGLIQKGEGMGPPRIWADRAAGCVWALVLLPLEDPFGNRQHNQNEEMNGKGQGNTPTASGCPSSIVSAMERAAALSFREVQIITVPRCAEAATRLRKYKQKGVLHGDQKEADAEYLQQQQQHQLGPWRAAKRNEYISCVPVWLPLAEGPPLVPVPTEGELKARGQRRRRKGKEKENETDDDRDSVDLGFTLSLTADRDERVTVLPRPPEDPQAQSLPKKEPQVKKDNEGEADSSASGVSSALSFSSWEEEKEKAAALAQSVNVPDKPRQTADLMSLVKRARDLLGGSSPSHSRGNKEEGAKAGKGKDFAELLEEIEGEGGKSVKGGEEGNLKGKGKGTDDADESDSEEEEADELSPLSVPTPGSQTSRRFRQLPPRPRVLAVPAQGQPGGVVKRA